MTAEGLRVRGKAQRHFKQSSEYLSPRVSFMSYFTSEFLINRLVSLPLVVHHAGHKMNTASRMFSYFATKVSPVSNSRRPRCTISGISTISKQPTRFTVRRIEQWRITKPHDWNLYACLCFHIVVRF